MNKFSFPFYHQLDSADCGPSCLRMIAKYYGKVYSAEMLRKHSFISREGVSMLGISDAAEYIGFRTLGVKISFEQLTTKPAYAVLYFHTPHQYLPNYVIQKASGQYAYLEI